MIYFFWWHKPLDIKCRVPLYLKSHSDYVFVPELARAAEIDNQQYYQTVIEEVLGESADANTTPEMQGQREGRSKQRKPVTSISRSVRRRVLSSGGPGHRIYRLYTKFMLEMKLGRESGSRISLFFLTIPFRALIFLTKSVLIIFGYTIYLPFGWIIIGSDMEDTISIKNHLPIFYSPHFEVEEDDATESAQGFVLFSLSAALVGGLHCTAWGWEFPSNAELLLWRIASLFITTLPISFLFAISLYFLKVRTLHQSEGPGIVLYTVL
ncbi:hypothetical protein CPC08DRAFT_822375 [Agrocybe pediades]|nr:hypothetical protein CPC08DRAFT_822375 [Agrocybe pediades]